MNQTLQILVVDDEVNIRKTLSVCLETEGHKVFGVSNFQDALDENLAPKESLPKIGDPLTLERIEDQHIRRILAATRSLQEAADILGVDQATLWRRRKKYEI
ncbi:MAG: hypothetical protein HY787_22520 [Deltaproteobacteria bacterium]|nr:hypothetical protein [Deltaproteobacteria bacterium]